MAFSIATNNVNFKDNVFERGTATRDKGSYVYGYYFPVTDFDAAAPGKPVERQRRRRRYASHSVDQSEGHAPAPLGAGASAPASVVGVESADGTSGASSRPRNAAPANDSPAMPNTDGLFSRGMSTNPLEQVFGCKYLSLLVVGTHVDKDGRLLVAVDAIDDGPPYELQASAIYSVSLDGKKFDLIYVSEHSSHGYVYDAERDRHVLLQYEGVVEIVGGKATVYPIPAPQPYQYPSFAPLTSMALAGADIVVSGEEGLLVTIAHGKSTPVAITPAFDEPFHAMHFRGAQGYCGGRDHLYGGSLTELRAIPLADSPRYEALTIESVHTKQDGGVMLGGKDDAYLYEHGKLTRIKGVHPGGTIGAVCEYKGVEYWGTQTSEFVQLSRRSGANLVHVYRTPIKAIRNRARVATRLRLHTHADLMVASYHTDIHLFDGKAWTKLRLAPDVSKPVKPLATSMTDTSVVDGTLEPTASPANQTWERPRSDGLYARQDHGWRVIRFFDDGTVTTESLMPDAKLLEAVKLMKTHRNAPRITVEGNHVHWDEPTARGHTPCAGSWSGEYLTLGEEASAGATPSGVRYDFFSLADIEASKRTGKASKKQPEPAGAIDCPKGTRRS